MNLKVTMTCSQKFFFDLISRKLKVCVKLQQPHSYLKAVLRGPWSGIFEISIYINYKATVDISI